MSMTKAEFDKKYRPVGKGSTLIEFMNNEVENIAKIIEENAYFPSKYTPPQAYYHFQNRLPDNLIQDFEHHEREFISYMFNYPEKKDASNLANANKNVKRKHINIRLIRSSDGQYLTIQNISSITASENLKKFD